MNLYDPARPAVNGQPGYVSNDGKLIGAMPHIRVVSATNPTELLLMVMLLVNPNTAKWFTTTLAVDQFPVFWAEFTTDPEGTFTQLFDWPGCSSKTTAQPTQTNSTKLTLADLGF